MLIVLSVCLPSDACVHKMKRRRVSPRRLPPSAPVLQQLVRALGMREQDLRDCVYALVCMPRHLAKCAADLPANPALQLGLGSFAVTIPTGTVAVAWDAFRDCTGLAQMTLPATVTVIKGGAKEYIAWGPLCGAFSGCASLTAVVLLVSQLAPGLTEIGGCAFYQCASLTEITLPPNLTEIGFAAFQGCASLKKIALPPNLTEIGGSAFKGCVSLVEITLPPNLTKISGFAFCNCTSLSEITLPLNLIEIGPAAFFKCTSLTKITLPPHLTEIGYNAFTRCSALATITLPPNLTKVQVGNFCRCALFCSLLRSG